MGVTRPADDRFWAKVDKTDDCWEWTGARKPTGYGNFWDGARYVLAHRFAYALLMGPIPEGLTIDHLCRVRYCVNPDHMDVVTLQENNERGMTLGVRNAAKTHCPHGHAYDLVNTYIDPGRGHRHCVTCMRQRERDRVRTRKAA
jgi:hypothetical protein